MKTEMTVTPDAPSSESGVFCNDDTHPAIPTSPADGLADLFAPPDAHIPDRVRQYLKELGWAYRERIYAHPSMQANPSDPKLGRPLTDAEVQALTMNIGAAAFRLMRGGRG